MRVFSSLRTLEMAQLLLKEGSPCWGRQIKSKFNKFAKVWWSMTRRSRKHKFKQLEIKISLEMLMKKTSCRTWKTSSYTRMMTLWSSHGRKGSWLLKLQQTQCQLMFLEQFPLFLARSFQIMHQRNLVTWLMRVLQCFSIQWWRAFWVLTWITLLQLMSLLLMPMSLLTSIKTRMLKIFSIRLFSQFKMMFWSISKVVTLVICTMITNFYLL